MSYSEVLAVTPDRRPIKLLELRNAHGHSPSIWRRLLVAHGHSEHWMSDDKPLDQLWHSIETLPEWQQVALVLTFDTGVIPWQEFEATADALDEFEKRLPSNPDHANHVPTIAELLRSKPEAPFVGIYGTSVSENPFDPWDYDKDEPGGGIPLSEMYLLERHRKWLPKEGE